MLSVLQESLCIHRNFALEGALSHQARAHMSCIACEEETSLQAHRLQGRPLWWQGTWDLTTAVCCGRKHVITEQGYIPQLVRCFEAEGVRPVPIFINGIEAHTVVRAPASAVPSGGFPHLLRSCPLRV